MFSHQFKPVQWFVSIISAKKVGVWVSHTLVQGQVPVFQLLVRCNTRTSFLHFLHLLFTVLDQMTYSLVETLACVEDTDSNTLCQLIRQWTSVCDTRNSKIYWLVWRSDMGMLLSLQCSLYPASLSRVSTTHVGHSLHNCSTASTCAYRIPYEANAWKIGSLTDTSAKSHYHFITWCISWLKCIKHGTLHLVNVQSTVCTVRSVSYKISSREHCTGACLGFEVGGAGRKILLLMRMCELYMDGYISRRGWKLHSTDWAVDDEQH